MSTNHWEMWKLSHAYSRIGSGTTPTSNQDQYYTDGEDEGGLPWVTTAELRETYIVNTASRITEEALKDFTALRVYGAGSLFIAMYGATIGRLGITRVPATCNQACCVLEKSAQFDNRFLFFWLWHRRRDLVAISTGGGQPNLSQQDIREELALCPPLKIQQGIAGFLDEKNSQINGLIEKKRALLDCLAEKRQALITRAVTKGLNPIAPMKPSGIDWLGDIPAHWEVRRLNCFCEFQSGKAHEPFIEPDGQYVCVNARYISTNGAAVKRCSENLMPASIGDILMVMSDLPNGRALARSFLVDDLDQYAVNQRVCRIRPKQGSPIYYSYLLNRNPQLLSHNDGKEQTHLSNSDFKLLQLLVPPETEQREIADHLNGTCIMLDKASSRVEESVSRLEEYRAALITAAVTGKLAGLQ
jgi:type I restriction enzyme S subunit